MLKKLFTKCCAAVLTAALTVSFYAYNIHQDANAAFLNALMNYDVADTSLITPEARTFDINSTTGVEGFVKRLYSICLEREPDLSGFNNWCNNLAEGVIPGAYAAEGFLNSPEFKNHNYSNEDYITILYRLFFDREPDEGGFTNWMNAMTYQNFSKEKVLYEFVDSKEWANTCASFGIMSGSFATPEWGDEVYDPVKVFVTNFYVECLDRQPDRGGFRNFYDGLSKKNLTGKQAAYGFLFSDEFTAKAKKLSKEQLVTIFYKVFFDREPDAVGLQNWVGALYWGGVPELFNGFADSAEFEAKCQKYRILAGPHIDVPSSNVDQNFVRFAEWNMSGINTVNTAPLNSHTSYKLYNTQGSKTKTTNYNISSKDLTAIQNFANTHFQPNWSTGQKAAYTMYWIHYNVDYAYNYDRIANMGYAQAIFEQKYGQCAQYNGAMCEMLCYLGLDANLVQGYRGTTSSKYQHFWCEVTINGKVYVVETGNKKDGDWWYFVVPYSGTRKYIKNGVVQG